MPLKTKMRLRLLLAVAVSASFFVGCRLGSAPDGVVDQCTSQLELPPAVSTDILFVIDNSNSMLEEQRKVIDQLAAFVNSLVSGPVKNDLRVGVVTTSVTRNQESCSGTGRECTDYGPPRAVPEAGRLQRGKDPVTGAVVDPSAEVIVSSAGDDAAAFVAKIRNLVSQGVMGSGQEMGLEAARRALSEPLLSISPNADPPGNQGFLRAGSRLLIIIISDEDDCSDASDCSDPAGRPAITGVCGGACTTDADCGEEGAYCVLKRPSDPSLGRACGLNACETRAGRARLEPIERYIEFFTTMRDGTAAAREREVFFAVIGAVDPTTLAPSRCRQGSDEAYGVATRYAAVTKAMGARGLITSICSPSYETALTEIAALVSTPQSLDLPKSPVDGHLLVVELQRSTGETVKCTMGDGFDFVAAAGDLPARLTFKDRCRLRPRDKLTVKLICAG